MTVIIFLIVLAVLIFVHELGHFLLARACGIRVDRFALGFGPRILSWKGKKTEYSLNLIPFGGYVKIFGEDPDQISLYGPEAYQSFANKSRPKQAAVLAAGVAFNFIFAWILYMSVFATGVTATTEGFDKYASNMSDRRIMITYVSADSPAAQSGLREGDVITGVNGEKSLNPSIEHIQESINKSIGKPVSIQYLRDGQNGSVQALPIAGIVEGKFAIGIAMDNVAELHLPVGAALWEGLKYTGLMIKETAAGIALFVGNIFRGQADFSEVAGPVGIAGIVGNAAGLGFNYLVMITALISVNLGVINLIPFPALDGGRILFVFIEGVIRRRISPKFTNVVNAVGFVLLMALMVAVTYKDIAKLLVK